MKKIALVVLALLALGAVKAQAGGVYDVGYSSIAIVGHAVTTGTSVNVLRSRPANWSYNVGQVRIQNQDATHSIWCGHRFDVSDSTTEKLGEKLTPGTSATYPAAKDPKSNAADPQIFCIAPSAAGTTNVKVSVVWMGY